MELPGAASSLSLADASTVPVGTRIDATAGKVDRGAQATAIPFVAWLGFATLLAERIWQRNPTLRLQAR